MGLAKNTGVRYLAIFGALRKLLNYPLNGSLNRAPVIVEATKKLVNSLLSVTKSCSQSLLRRLRNHIKFSTEP